MLRGLREIDIQASKIHRSFKDKDDGYLKTIISGSKMLPDVIASINEDFDSACPYFHEHPASAEHIRWTCKAFHETRVATDADIAAIPMAYLLPCLQCGIAPAMKTNGSQTYWGQNFDDSTSTKIKRLLGFDDVLHKHATDGTEEQKRIEARRILEEDDNASLNARELILKANGHTELAWIPTSPHKMRLKPITLPLS